MHFEKHVFTLSFCVECRSAKLLFYPFTINCTVSGQRGKIFVKPLCVGVGWGLHLIFHETLESKVPTIKIGAELISRISSCHNKVKHITANELISSQQSLKF